jgi:hypothetical protein
LFFSDGKASYDETLCYFNGLFIIDGIYYFFGGRPRFFFNITGTPLSIYDAVACKSGELFFVIISVFGLFTYLIWRAEKDYRLGTFIF